MSIFVFVVQILLIAFFAVTSLMKLFSHPHMVIEFKRFKLPYGLARFAGSVEVIAVICLILGFFEVAYLILGSIILTATMIGAAYVNFIKRPPIFGYGTLMIMLICIVPTIYHLDDMSQLVHGILEG